jgi:hypothetical protein
MNKREGLFHIVQLHELGVESHCIIELRPVFQMDSCSSSVVDAIDLIKKLRVAVLKINHMQENTAGLWWR